MLQYYICFFLMWYQNCSREFPLPLMLIVILFTAIGTLFLTIQLNILKLQIFLANMARYKEN